ncbi:MAG: YdcF family protein [Methylovulum sp.]|uniref:YdcF family protein n=1 Tax=Methylovulum sp. TaxID=1916980 RepID=UPI0026384566|nr:YdcF family protein [Methylovulum sp.]MDD2725442.1 YdcF family protein [Methylovulum sp.]MDD5124479.1 YdcF family protein [Methylovulum sp.]
MSQLGSGLIVKHALKLFGCLLILWLAVSLYLAVEGLQDRLGHADAALVLGNTVNPDGTPSPRLKARLDKTLALYQMGYFHTIISSGAVGKEGHDEAVVMKNYLLAHGVAATGIIADSRGNNTLASSQNTLQILKQRNLTSVLVVSQYFHLPRSRWMLTRCHISSVYSAHADYFEWRDVYSTLRETIAFLSYFFLHDQCD